MKFAFQARTKKGKIQTGMIEASNKEAAIDILKEQELYISNIEEVYTPVYAKRITLFERVSNKEIVLFSRQLAILLKSQVPLVETLETLAKQIKKPGFKEAILRILEQVEGGTPLSQALSFFPKIFSKFYVNMVKAGEASGKLTDVFVYLADYLEKQYKFKSKITGAMIYPAFVIVVFVFVSGLIITFVIPQLTAVLKETNQQLPLVTRIIMGLGDFMKAWWWTVLLGLGFISVGVYQFQRTEIGKDFLDRFSLRIPLIGAFLKKIYISQFALNLSTLIGGGLPIVTSLEITADIVGNNVYKNIIQETKDGVRRGETISSILERYPAYIYPLLYQMVYVGEKTGTLDSSLKNVVTFYEDDVDRTLEQLIRLLEPILIILLAGVVGLLLGAVLVPIYSIQL